MRAMVIALLLSACYSPTPPAGAPCGENNACPSGQSCVAGFCTTGGGSNAIDAPVTPIDAAPDAPTCSLWNAKHFDACAIPAPMGDLHLTATLGDYTWDTTAGTLKGKMNTTIPVTTTTLTQSDGPDVLLASVQNFTLDANVNLLGVGTRPLLIAVWGTATIGGNVDFSGTGVIPGPGGAGTATTFCPGATGATGAAGTPATGGGGGAFQGMGGTGGNTGGAGGSPLAVSAVIRGGCAGNLGGAGSTTQAPRGAGGGALQITARVAIDVPSTGRINVGGGGGAGGRANYGAGGGGGAGGYLGFDAPTVTIAGIVAANGGSGGGGASDVAAGSTGLGALASGSPVLGGAGATTTNIGACGKGGDGSAGGSLIGQPGATSACGGGGGGGAAGYILVWSPNLSVTGTISPPATGGP